MADQHDSDGMPPALLMSEDLMHSCLWAGTPLALHTLQHSGCARPWPFTWSITPMTRSQLPLTYHASAA